MTDRGDSKFSQSTAHVISEIYRRLQNNILRFQTMTKRPLTLSEKVLIGHLDHQAGPDLENNLERGESYVSLRPDRVALQDVTGQMTLLQFMQTGLQHTKVPTTVHCDHLIQARVEGEQDTRTALYENSEVYQFLESASKKYGLGFWKPGAGIIHQVVLENYAFPGGLMIGTDSHTPNAGGLGMLAIGVGGLDAAEVMAGLPWELLYPKRIGVLLTGVLNGWTSPKDIILHVASILTVAGGTNAIIEYFGPGCITLSCTGKATITNMGAEIGATTSIFPYDRKMSEYLAATGRSEIAELADRHFSILRQDPEIEREILLNRGNSSKYFDQLIELNLTELEPYIVGPHTPDLARPVSDMASDVRKNGYVDEISVALIGSCTNSSYEDMSRAADVAEQANARGLKTNIPLQVTPGSEMIRSTIERDGQMDLLKRIGANVLANACGPCIGQWQRSEVKAGVPNSIVTSYNRNFPGRNDGRRETMNFITSPEMVVALALGGKLSFNPLNDELVASDGRLFKLEPPKIAPEVPSLGFAYVTDTFVGPSSDPENTKVVIREGSDRLQKLEPFPAWDGREFEDLVILAKVAGKCTTDHISPAGAWLMYRGHLDKISDNLLLGAMNSFNGKIGIGKNVLNNQIGPFPEIARMYRDQGIKWIIIGDMNYGEGSSREHAAMSPRYLGCAAVIARSFARIHETNLKKQGVLAATLANKSDFEKVLEDDRVSIHGLNRLEPGKPLECILHHGNQGKETIWLQHSYNEAQIEWFKMGSALNIIKNRKP
ncbi:MAG: aconitate hydratase [Nitrososphaeraceae archaeon]